MSKRKIIIGVGVVVLAIGWYAFRPELLFINQTVNEEFPGGSAMASIEKGPMSLTKGSFRASRMKPEDWPQSTNSPTVSAP
jgi:hypothetical protein